jgi:iron complex outermembrane receptor protein
MRKLFFEVTFFRYVVDREIVPFVINQKTFFRNAGTTNRTGVEVGFKCEPAEGIELVTNYTFTHFRYDEYTATVYTPSGSRTETYTGNTVPSVPEHIMNFIVNYELEISDEFSGLLQWDCDYISRMYVDDANLETSSGFFYGNVMAGLNLSAGPLNAIAFAGSSNIFDRRYSGFISINDYFNRYFETGEPRNVFAGLNLSYRL